MTLEPNDFALEISKALTAASEDYTTTTINLNEYGTSCEITRQGSAKQLYITPADDYLIDMVLYDKTGAAIASGTIFSEAAKNITPGQLTTIIEACL